MEELYNYILEGLRNSDDFYHQELHGTFENYLQLLQEPTKQLRKAYRDDNVIVDYSTSECQAAYLICYYPHYVEMILEVFRLLTTELSHKEQINACFFGSGPCPELVALVQFLKEHSSISHIIDAKSYDILAEQWKFAREITGRYIIPKIKPEWWQGNNSYLRPRRIDLCAKDCFKEQEIESNIKNSNLFVFQNCLNELDNHDIFQSNIDDLLDLVPLESLIIITDLLHNQNSNIKSEICQKSKNRGDFLVLQSGKLKIKSSLSIPLIIIQYLLTGESDLIPRSSIKFSYLVLKKSNNIEIEDENDLDNIPY